MKVRVFRTDGFPNMEHTQVLEVFDHERYFEVRQQHTVTHYPHHTIDHVEMDDCEFSPIPYWGSKDPRYIARKEQA